MFSLISLDVKDRINTHEYER